MPPGASVIAELAFPERKKRQQGCRRYRFDKRSITHCLRYTRTNRLSREKRWKAMLPLMCLTTRTDSQLPLSMS